MFFCGDAGWSVLQGRKKRKCHQTYICPYIAQKAACLAFTNVQQHGLYQHIPWHVLLDRKHA